MDRVASHRTSALDGSPDEALIKAWTDLGSVDCIVERFVDFVTEISVVLARGGDGAIAAYDVIQNRHRAGILPPERRGNPEEGRRIRRLG